MEVTVETDRRRKQQATAGNVRFCKMAAVTPLEGSANLQVTTPQEVQ
jgi:hypothetical protein